jgi:3-dehydroquinate dehydratase-1
MLKLGSLRLDRTDGRPRVAVGFADSDVVENVRGAIEAGVDVAEVRIDQFSTLDADHVIEHLKLFAGLPTISTIRLHDEGGCWDGDEDARRELMTAILPFTDAIDIELQSRSTLAKIAPAAKSQGKLLVVSHHNFDATPSLPELRTIVGAAKDAGADIVKIATHVETPADVQVLAEVLIEQSALNLIVIGMGSKGLVTRVMFPALGSLLTFAANGAHSTAPGQLPYTKTFELLRSVYPAYNEDKIIELELIEAF